MKRKLIGVILMAVMVCSLAACGSKETKETKADADKSGTPVLRVAMECGYAPYNWTQSDDSNGAVPIEDSKDYAYGYDVMMAKKIADKLGCELQIVKLDWDSLIPAVQSGTVDCVIAGHVSSIREWPYRFSSNRYSDSKSSMCCLSGSEDFRFYRYR